MPIDKVVGSVSESLQTVESGSIVLVGGFGGAGSPTMLLKALAKMSLRDLTVVSNNGGAATTGLGVLLLSGSVRRLICSYPRSADGDVFTELYEAGRLELELVPQGTLSERIRAAGAGIGGFYTKTAVGTELAAGKELRTFGNSDYVLELPIAADVALIAADRADRWGNLTYSGSARNFGPTMAMAARLTIAEVNRVVPLGSLDPEHVVTPGIFVDRVVERSHAK